MGPKRWPRRGLCLQSAIFFKNKNQQPRFKMERFYNKILFLAFFFRKQKARGHWVPIQGLLRPSRSQLTQRKTLQSPPSTPVPTPPSPAPDPLLLPLSPLFTGLQPHGPPRFLQLPGLLLPQGLCTSLLLLPSLSHTLPHSGLYFHATVAVTPSLNTLFETAAPHFPSPCSLPCLPSRHRSP